MIKEKLDIPYQFIEEIKDLLTEYEDSGMVIFFSVWAYISQNNIYDYIYHRTKITVDIYYQKEINDILEIYKRNNIPLNKFVYCIIINDKKIAIKFVDRLKQIYPNINTDISHYDVKWSNYDNKLNNNTNRIYFILN